MAEKKVTVIVGKDGKMAMSFGGFSGNSCFDEARKIQARLKSLGVMIDCEGVITTDQDVLDVLSGGIKNEFKHS